MRRSYYRSIGSVRLGCLEVRILVGIFTNVTLEVTVVVAVVFVADKNVITSAGGFMPVSVFIGYPNVSVVGVLADYGASACFADLVTVFVVVNALVSNFNVVTAGNVLPVVLTVVGVVGSIGVITELILAKLAEAVVVFVGVSRLVGNFNVVTAGYCVPVIVTVDRPFGSVGVSADNVFTNLTDTVIIFVGVSCLRGNGCSGVHTYGCVPVILAVRRPLGAILVIAELLLAKLAESVVVFVRAGMS